LSQQDDDTNLRNVYTYVRRKHPKPVPPAIPSAMDDLPETILSLDGLTLSQKVRAMCKWGVEMDRKV